MKFDIALGICISQLTCIVISEAAIHPENIGQHIFTHGINFNAQTVNSPATQCRRLQAVLGDMVLLPNDTAYKARLQAYWASNQIDLKPHCRIMPRTNTEAAAAVRAFSHEKASFAVESGGHSSITGASNIDDGVALDLSLLADIMLSSDGSVLHIGTGARWLDVYEFLERANLDLSVNGARAGSVGVGGFLLGGGISVSSNRYGWACDSVEAIEVITGNGSLIESNATYHNQLFASMKGTGSALGIATRFSLKTYPATPLEMAFIAYDWKHLQSILSALEHFNNDASSDQTASADLSVSYDPSTHEIILVVMLSSTDIKSSPALAHFHAIPNIHHSHQRTTHAQLARILDMNNPRGYRQHKATLTVSNNATLIAEIVRIYAAFAARSEYAHARDDAYRSGLLVQPLTVPHLRRSKENGSAGANMLGLEDMTEPLFCKFVVFHSTISPSRC